MNGSSQPAEFDIVVIGGGINGCGIARDAAGRGYRVFLCEMNDLASGTSSWSTKLIHGGLRYLEHYEFRLVRESLLERELLWRMAPHIIWPLRFVLPHHSALRPAWLLRLGLFLYDHIGGRRQLPPTKMLDLRRDPAGAPLKPLFRKAFEYSDCWVDDSRLVVLNALDAARRGAIIRTRSPCVSARRVKPYWLVSVRDETTGRIEQIKARALVNAAGPWVDKVLQQVLGRNDAHNVRLVQGSHIVVHKLYEHDRCYIFQTADSRIVFAIPYEQDFTLIGTTDLDYDGDPGQAAISDEETDYLLAAASQYFRKPVKRDAIVWSYSGVRPLFDDGAARAQDATRDYVLSVDASNGEPPLVNIFGGKITTYRRLAEAVVSALEDRLGRCGQAWTAASPLPGGDFPIGGFSALCTDLEKRFPFLTPHHVRRLVRAYGTEAGQILQGVTNESGLGRHFGATLYETELRYLMETEWAQRADDVLWRRSKLGLRFTKEAAKALDSWMIGAPDAHSLTAAQ